jgi:hypothetical protein
MEVLVSKEELGFFLPVHTISHYNYFMNTLNMHHKSMCSNPMDKPETVKALSYISKIVQSDLEDDLIDTSELNVTPA